MKVSNIPRGMDLRVLRADMESYGTVVTWAAPPGALHVYAVYETKEMASRATQGLREHRRIIVEPAYLYG